MTPELAAVLPAWGIEPGAARAVIARSGPVQETFFVDVAARPRLVVQRMHPMFDAAVLEDIDAVSEHLASRKLATQRLVRTAGGGRGVADASGRWWRALTYLEGWTVERVGLAPMAAAAGGVVGRFHVAASTLAHDFRFVRAGAHDTAAFLARLTRAAGGDGPDEARALAAAILDFARPLELGALAALPRRVTHGDLNISNVLFAWDGEGRALLDLESVGRQPLPVDLGNAWRSWCNPLGDDGGAARFDLDIFTAAVAGYAAAAGGFVEGAERDALVLGVLTITTELAARFCLDAFADHHFRWDPSRFPSRRAHNLARAAGQLDLARQVAKARPRAEAAVDQAFRRARLES